MGKRLYRLDLPAHLLNVADPFDLFLQLRLDELDSLLLPQLLVIDILALNVEVLINLSELLPDVRIESLLEVFISCHCLIQTVLHSLDFLLLVHLLLFEHLDRVVDLNSHIVLQLVNRQAHSSDDLGVTIVLLSNLTHCVRKPLIALAYPGFVLSLTLEQFLDKLVMVPLDLLHFDYKLTFFTNDALYMVKIYLHFIIVPLQCANNLPDLLNVFRHVYRLHFLIHHVAYILLELFELFLDTFT